MVNEGDAEVIAKRANRFATLGTIAIRTAKPPPMNLNTVMTQLAFHCVQIPTNIIGGEVTNPHTAPFWAAPEWLNGIRP